MIDFSNWQAVLSTLASLALITIIGMGLRMLLMMTVQERRQRQNRQINERLKVLIAAYKTLGGSFTGDLTVDPMHMRELRRAARRADAIDGTERADESPVKPPPLDLSEEAQGGSDRARRIRDSVEGALSDILLLGTEDHVRLAAAALGELVAGRRVHTHELVVSLRDFIRKALDLDPIPSSVAASLPAQGPTRPGGAGGSGGRGQGGNSAGSAGGGGAGGSGGMLAGGALGVSASDDAESPNRSDPGLPR